ncbi:MAG: diguanylate cyclase [Thermodesulfovibrionales bacterium]
MFSIASGLSGQAGLGTSVKEPRSTIKKQYKLSVSIGVAYHDPENPQTLDKLLTDADKMMYKLKQSK